MRFVVITLPPADLCDRIEAIRRPLNETVGGREALRYPPHITLRTGLVCPDDRAAEVAGAFLAHAAAFGPVPIQTEGVFFTAYGPPGDERGLVGWSIAATGGLLALHRKLLEFQEWQKGPQGLFRPHLTLAFHDIGPGHVETLRRELSAARVTLPDFSWTADHVALYHERPEGWVEWGRAGLGQPT